MSPFLTYVEVMPGKPAKDLCYYQLPKFLHFLVENNKEQPEKGEQKSP